MFKRVGAIGAMGAAIAVAVATALSGTASARLSPTALATATASCGSPVTIGFAYPATGAASIGVQQYDWAKWAVKSWNKANKPKIALQPADTALGAPVDQSVASAQALSGNGNVLAVSGVPGSQQVEDSISVYKSGGLAPISGSATRIALTRGSPRETPSGGFFRTVPNDSVQGGTDAHYIAKVLKVKNVWIIDDEEAYSQGLKAAMTTDLKKFGVKVGGDSLPQQNPNYQGAITKIKSSVQLVVIPWQLSAMAQTFFTDLRAAHKHQIVFGSDGVWDPTTFKGVGAYVSGFPVDPKSPTIAAFAKAHNHSAELFGVPSYTSVWANATAIKMACAAGHGSASRATIKKNIPKVSIAKTASLLGFPVKFLTHNSGHYKGAGDLAGSTVNFGIYKILAGGKYKPVA
jgi:branched-chain amino acid transport system substrate-binding protein